jgi:hypothetical protein
MQPHGPNLRDQLSVWIAGRSTQNASKSAHAWATFSVALALLLGSPLLALAHIDQPAPALLDQPWQHAYPTPQLQQPSPPVMPEAPPFVLFVLMVVAMVRGMWRWRRLAVPALVLVLGTFTFGTAVHSVHHLADPTRAPECPVFSAAQHVSGTLTEPSDIYASGLTAPAASLGHSEVPAFTLRFRSDLPRAPPFSLL